MGIPSALFFSPAGVKTMTALESPLAATFPELFRDEVFRIETPRLWLRWPTIADAPALHEIASLEAVARHTATWPHPFPDGEAMRRIVSSREANTAGSGLVLALAPKARPDRLIGIVGLARIDGGNALELVYLLGIEHQGYGLMTEAVRALSAAVFRYTPFTRIEGVSGLTNIASRRVMEKAGFSATGRSSRPAPARASRVECDTLQLTRTEWLGRPYIRPAGERTRGMIEASCGHAA